MRRRSILALLGALLGALGWDGPSAGADAMPDVTRVHLSLVSATNTTTVLRLQNPEASDTVSHFPWMSVRTTGYVWRDVSVTSILVDGRPLGRDDRFAIPAGATLIVSVTHEPLRPSDEIRLVFGTTDVWIYAPSLVRTP